MRSSLAILAMVLGACGDDGVHHLADAPPAGLDGAADAPPDGPVAPVTVTVKSDGAPLTGVKVYFQAPDQAEIATTTTDATGVASAVMPHGGYVTALDPFTTPSTGFHDLHTWADVKPGDHLVLDTVPGSKSPLATITVKVTADVAGAPSSYGVYSQCGTTTFPLAKRAGVIPAPMTATLSIYAPCGPTVDIVVIDFDASNVPINFLAQTSVAVADGTVDLSTAGWQGTVPTTITDSGLPANAISAASYLYGLGPSIGQIDVANVHDTLAIANNSVSYQTSIVPPATLTPWEETEVGTSTTSTISHHVLARWGATPDASTTNYSQTLSMLPDITTLGTFDPATQTLSWATATSANTPDYYLAALDGTNASFDWEWQIVGKYTGASIAYPTLPGDGAMYTPDASARVKDLTLARSIGGYDIARPLLFDLYQGSYFQPERAPISAATTAGSYEYVWADPQATAKRVPQHRRRYR